MTQANTNRSTEHDKSVARMLAQCLAEHAAGRRHQEAVDLLSSLNGLQAVYVYGIAQGVLVQQGLNPALLAPIVKECGEWMVATDQVRSPDTPAQPQRVRSDANQGDMIRISGQDFLVTETRQYSVRLLRCGERPGQGFSVPYAKLSDLGAVYVSRA